MIITTLNWISEIISKYLMVFCLYQELLYTLHFDVSLNNAYINSCLAPTSRLWNSLPEEGFPLTYDLNGFKTRANGQLSTLASF